MPTFKNKLEYQIYDEVSILSTKWKWKSVYKVVTVDNKVAPFYNIITSNITNFVLLILIQPQ